MAQTACAVKLFVTTSCRSYMEPWLVKPQKQCTGTGFATQNRLIVTNAHVVQDAQVVEVKKNSHSKKYPARVICIGHDVDLALVEVVDQSFWMEPEAQVFIDLSSADQEYPELYSEVRTVGFPAGGNTVCVTRGVISRLDGHVYVHPRCQSIFEGTVNSPGYLPIIQIDAAINQGNSGGPVFDAYGRCVGVASSTLPSAQNVGYIIPLDIVLLFVCEHRDTGKWTGISEIGLRCSTLESDAMREYLQMGERSGLRIRSVAPLGAASKVVRAGDILLEVDGYAVSNEGYVCLPFSGQKVEIPYDVLVTRKRKGEPSVLKLLREGQEHQETVVFGPIAPLAPRFDRYDSSPEYLMLGGMMFTKLTIPLINEYLHSTPEQQRNNFIDTSVISEATEKWKNGTEELVVRVRCFKHQVNLGYTCASMCVLRRFNGADVVTFAGLAELAATALCPNGPGSPFIIFDFDQAGRTPSSQVVLRAADIRDADNEICKNQHIPMTQKLAAPLARPQFV